jgi:hypothetical protein
MYVSTIIHGSCQNRNEYATPQRKTQGTPGYHRNQVEHFLLFDESNRIFDVLDGAAFFFFEIGGFSWNVVRPCVLRDLSLIERVLFFTCTFIERNRFLFGESQRAKQQRA